MMRAVVMSLVLAGALLYASPAQSHHSNVAYEVTKVITVTGVVKEFRWVNPHTWIHVEVTKPDGSKEEWMIEGGSPNSLLRHGLNKDSLPAGTEIVVDGYQARDHSLLRANGRNVTYPDGRKLFLGSSGPGAPPENATPTEKAKP